MKLGFMSSVCPKMSLSELIDIGGKYGYEGIEFRPEWKHGHGIEVDATADQRKEAKKILDDSALEGMCVAPGCKFCSPEAKVRDEQYELLMRYIELAADVGIPYIRVFGDPIPKFGGGARTTTLQIESEYLVRAAAEAEKAGVVLALETHSNLRALDVGDILYRAAYPPALRINWHLAHCLNHGEDVDEAYRHVKGLVVHAHYSLPDETEGEYGAVKRQAQLLEAEGFDGYFSLEIINPDDSEATLATQAKRWKKMRESM